MQSAQLVAVLELEVSELRTGFPHLAAQIRECETQIAAFKRNIDHEDELVRFPSAETFISVLRAVGGTLSPSAILVRVLAAKRDDDLQMVTATLNYLETPQLVT